MPKKTVDQFKEIFSPIKKPSMPKGVPKGYKADIEKAIKPNLRLGKWDEIKVEMKKLSDADPEYFVDLVAYKIKKHLDGDQTERIWLDFSGDEAVGKALKKIIPGDMSDPATLQLYKKAMDGKNENIIKLITRRDPEGVRLLQTAPNRKALTDALETGDDEKLKTESSNNISWLSDKEVVEIARKNPDRFFKTALVGFKDNAKFVERMKNEAFRNDLKAIDSEAWAEFVKGTPMLAALADAEKKVADKKLTKTGDVMKEVFSSVLDSGSVPLGYAATALDPNNVILAGPTDKSKEFRAKQKEQKDKTGDPMPDNPATDCHHLLYIVQSQMEMFPGHKPKIVNRSCPDMLMTVPLDSLDKLPNKGLLDRKFKGNVFDKDGNATKRVFFSGDGGINSHTWLMVDDVPFDPVMGTQGDDVAAAAEEIFKWTIKDKVATGNKGSYLIPSDTLKPETNAMGFSKGYYLTTEKAKAEELSKETLS